MLVISFLLNRSHHNELIQRAHPVTPQTEPELAALVKELRGAPAIRLVQYFHCAGKHVERLHLRAWGTAGGGGVRRRVGHHGRRRAALHHRARTGARLPGTYLAEFARGRHVRHSQPVPGCRRAVLLVPLVEPRLRILRRPGRVAGLWKTGKSRLGAGQTGGRLLCDPFSARPAAGAAAASKRKTIIWRTTCAKCSPPTP